MSAGGIPRIENGIRGAHTTVRGPPVLPSPTSQPRRVCMPVSDPRKAKRPFMPALYKCTRTRPLIESQSTGQV